MNRLSSEVALLLLVAGIAYGQVNLRLPDTTAVPASSLILPIAVEEFSHVGSFSLAISFDKNVLTYKGVTGQPKFGVFNATPAVTANKIGTIALSWFNVNPSLNIPKGKLLDLLFTYKSGTSPLTFVNMVPSSVTDSLANNLKATFKHGKVSPRTAPPGAQRAKRPVGVK